MVVVALLLSLSLSIPVYVDGMNQEKTNAVDKRENRTRLCTFLNILANSNNLSAKSLLYASQQIAFLREKQSRHLKDSADYTQTNGGEEEDSDEIRVERKRSRRKRHASRYSSLDNVEQEKKMGSKKMDFTSIIPIIDVEVMNVRAHEATVVVKVDVPSWVWCQILTAEESAQGREFTTSLRRYDVASILSFRYNWLASRSSFAVTCKARNQKNAAHERLSETQHFTTLQETSCMLNRHQNRFERSMYLINSGSHPGLSFSSPDLSFLHLLPAPSQPCHLLSLHPWK